MEKEILQRLQQFRLQDVEEGRLLVAEEDLRDSTEEWLRSLVGKIYGDKVANFTGVRKVFTSLWADSGLLKIKEMGRNLYLFVFDTQEHQQKVLNGKAWTYDSQFLMLKPWREEMDLTTELFHRVYLWVQVWNLPSHWLSKDIGFKFQKSFGTVCDVIIPEYGSKKGLYMKVLAEVDLDKPLPRGCKLQYKGRDVWVEFKYENFAQFCYYCGHVGHVDRHCGARKRDAIAGQLLEGQYGDWMMAAPLRTTIPKDILPGTAPGRPGQVVLDALQGRKDDGQRLAQDGIPFTVDNILDKEDTRQVVAAVCQEVNREPITVEEGRGPIAKGIEVGSLLEQVRIYEEVDRGDSSHHSFIIAPSPVMMDMDNQETTAFSLNNLINIPVDLSASRGGLQAVTIRSKEGKKREVPTRGKGGKGTWKRMQGKENVAPPQPDATLSGAELGGQKRPWQLRDEEEEICSGQDPNKRFKEAEAFDSQDPSQVGVASLEWPQLDQ